MKRADLSVMDRLIPFYSCGEFVTFLDRETTRQAERYGPHLPLSRRLHQIADEAKTFARCYFIGGAEGPVKIGYSADVVDRLRTLCLSSPVPLGILATRAGGAAREAAYHEQFAAHRLHGEWFDRHPDILAEIERLPRPAATGRALTTSRRRA